MLNRVDRACRRLCRAAALVPLLNAVADEFRTALGGERTAAGVHRDGTCEWPVVIDGDGRPAEGGDLPVRLVPRLQGMGESGAFTWETYQALDRPTRERANKNKRCALLFPIKGSERRLGHVYVEARRRAWDFEAGEVEYLSLLARQAGLIWENLDAQEARKAVDAMHRDLNAARQVQLNLFPSDAELHPRLDIAAQNIPALRVSGDYYDFQLMGPNRVAFILADVMGHGLSAALLMSCVQACFRLGVRSGWDLPGFDAEISQMVQSSGGESRFVTGVLGMCDLETDTLSLLSAGHPWPSLLVGGRIVEPGEEAATFPWGIPVDRACTPFAFPLAGRPWSLAAYSDGISESFDRHGNPYSSLRVDAQHRRLGEKSAEAICGDIVADVFRETDNRTFMYDDMTLLVVRSRSADAM